MVLIIIGWDDRKLKDFGVVKKKHCPKCNELVDWKIYEERFRFTLFFIPIFAHDSFYYFVCSKCSTGDKISKFDFDDYRGKSII